MGRPAPASDPLGAAATWSRAGAHGAGFTLGTLMNPAVLVGFARPTVDTFGPPLPVRLMGGVWWSRGSAALYKRRGMEDCVVVTSGDFGSIQQRIGLTSAEGSQYRSWMMMTPRDDFSCNRIGRSMTNDVGNPIRSPFDGSGAGTRCRFVASRPCAKSVDAGRSGRV